MQEKSRVVGEHLDCPTRAHTAHRGEGWRSTRIPHLTPITQGPRADPPCVVSTINVTPTKFEKFKVNAI